MSSPLARPEARRALARLLGLDPTLVLALDAHSTPEPRVMAWLLGCCCLSIAAVALGSAAALRACSLHPALVTLGALFAGLCTLNLMRLVHACAGLSAKLNEELLAVTVRPAWVPATLLLAVAGLMSQAACAALLADRPSLSRAWQLHPWLAAALTLLMAAAIAAPALVRLMLPEAARSFEHAQRELIERRIASQRDTCAELCDTLIAYELDRLNALQD